MQARFELLAFFRRSRIASLSIDFYVRTYTAPVLRMYICGKSTCQQDRERTKGQSTTNLPSLQASKHQDSWSSATGICQASILPSCHTASRSRRRQPSVAGIGRDVHHRASRPSRKCCFSGATSPAISVRPCGAVVHGLEMPAEIGGEQISGDGHRCSPTRWWCAASPGGN